MSRTPDGVPRSRFPERRVNFGDSAINKGYCVFFIAHARNGRISTSGLKSDVTIVFFEHYFLKDAKISAIRVYLRRDIGLLNICMGFQDLLAENEGW